MSMPVSATSTAPAAPTTPASATSTGSDPPATPAGSGALGGGSTLLRLAGLPLATLAQGSDPQLAALLTELDRNTAAYQEWASRVAEQLGDLLVPHPGLSRAQRGTALLVRRALHRGDPAPASITALAGLAAKLLPDSDLADALRGVHVAADALRRAGHTAECSVTAEEARLLALPWQLLHDHPAGRHALRNGDVAIFEEIAGRVARGEPWTTKRMRQRSEYLWRMLARGSTRATPRGWLAHVAALRVTDAETTGWAAGEVLVVRDLAATEMVDNLDEFRSVRATSATVLADDEATVAIAPLAWQDVGQVSVWLVEGEQRRKLVAMRLRRSAVLDAVWSRLSGGPQPVVRLVDALAGSDPTRRDALRRFLAHLVGVGALQLGAAPHPTYTRWQSVAAFQPPAATELASSQAYLDVYRQPAGDLGRAHAHELSDLIGQALRVLALADSDRSTTPPALPRALTEQPRRLLDVVAECVEVDNGFGGHGDHRHDWPTPRDPDSGYARLVRWIDTRLPKGAARVHGDGIDLDPGTLDRCGAPEQPLDWPMDVLLRPIAGRAKPTAVQTGHISRTSGRSLPHTSRASGPSEPVALLADLAPAGVLDARFLPALRRLGAELPHAEAYQRFLSRLGDRTDVPFVELLVPSMSTMAANAVRRPGYTRFWTGDPDLTGYFPDGARRPTTYLPLSAITLRANGGRVIAEADGRRIWPITHTARVPRPPWDVIRALLLRASPQTDRRTWRPLTYSLPAWPDRDYLPRIAVGGGRLVLTPAQWRISRAELGRPDDSLLDRMRALTRLRRRLGLPRWVTVVTDPHDEPTTVDLESVRAPRVVDRLPAGHPALLVSELLPAPDQLPVYDEATPTGSGSLAELIFRVPFDTTADAAAGLVAARIHRPPGPSPEAPPDRPVSTENPPPNQRMVPHGPVRIR